jgi:hypothetical protein
MPGVFRDGAASLRAETEHASSMLHAELRDGAASLHAEPEHASSMLHVGLRAAASLETEHASSRLHAARGDAAGHGSVDEPSPIARYRDATNADSSLAGSAPHVGRHDATNLVGDAELVLVTLGFKKLEAKRAVEAAMDLGRAPPTLDRLV